MPTRYAFPHYNLLLKEHPPSTANELVASMECGDKCDVLCFLYDQDTPESFDHAKRLYDKLIKPGPRALFVALSKDGSKGNSKVADIKAPVVSLVLDRGEAHQQCLPVLEQIVDMALHPVLDLEDSSWTFSSILNYTMVAAGMRMVFLATHGCHRYTL